MCDCSEGFFVYQNIPGILIFRDADIQPLFPFPTIISRIVAAKARYFKRNHLSDVAFIIIPPTINKNVNTHIPGIGVCVFTLIQIISYTYIH